MGQRVSGFDFSSVRQTIIAKGGTAEQADNALRDMLIILHAVEDTGEPHAITKAADQALHGLLLDTALVMRFSGTVFGAGHVLVHDPRAYGTPAFDVAWQNTRAAFAKHGIDLPADYRSGAEGQRSAESCLIQAAAMSGLQAESCLVQVAHLKEMQAAA